MERVLKLVFTLSLLSLAGRLAAQTAALPPNRSPSVSRSALQTAPADEPHLGPAEDALVGVIVTYRDADRKVIEVRHGNGFVLRCDGYVILPLDLLWDRKEHGLGDGAIEIIAHPGTPREVRYAGPKRVPYHNPAFDYVVIKLANVHLTAVRTLLPDTLSRHDPLQIVWSDWNAEKKRFALPQKREARFGDDIDATARFGVVTFEEPVKNVPVGAAVTGPEGMALGLVPGLETSETRTRFLSLRYLNRFSNCVAPVPVPDAVFARTHPGALPKEEKKEEKTEVAADSPGEAPPGAATKKDATDADPNQPRADNDLEEMPMVAVPGGPVVLPDIIPKSHPELLGSTSACAAPFLVDRYQVTNAQFWKFWNSLPGKMGKDIAYRRSLWPAGWAGSGEPFPASLGRTPVLGVTLDAANAYAKAQGKRLLTPAEWCLAAFGPAGFQKLPAWMTQYIADTNATYKRICDAHIEYLRTHTGIHSQDLLPDTIQMGGGPGSDPAQIFYDHGVPIIGGQLDYRLHSWHFLPAMPWVAIPPATSLYPVNTQGSIDMMYFSRRTFEGEAEPLYTKWKEPLSILPAGSREFDVTPYGLNDIFWNAREFVLPPTTMLGKGLTLFFTRVNAPMYRFGRTTADILEFPNYVGKDEYPLREVFPDVLPLARIIRKPAPSPFWHTIVGATNLTRIRMMTFPIVGWKLAALEGRQTIEVPMPHVIVPVLQYYINPPQLRAQEILNPEPRMFPDPFPEWYTGWMDAPKHFVPEIGSNLPVDLLEALPANASVLRSVGSFEVVVPNGFRCAR